MLDRIRGRGKSDPALEEVRRKTAARLAAIVGLTGEAELDTDLDPTLGAPAEAAEDGSESWEADEAEAPMLAIAATAGGSASGEDDGGADDADFADDEWDAAPAGRADAELDAELGADVESDAAPEPDIAPPPPLAPTSLPPSRPDAEPEPDAAPALSATSDAQGSSSLEADLAQASDETIAPAEAPSVVEATGDRAVAPAQGRQSVSATTGAASRAKERRSAASAGRAVDGSAKARQPAATAPTAATGPAKAAKAVASSPKATQTRSAKAASAGVAAPVKGAAAVTATRTAKAASPAVPPIASGLPSGGEPKAIAPARRAPAASPARGRRKKASTDLPAACPTCGRALEEIPTTSRRCVGCRARIVPKRVDGRTVLLAEAVVPLFEAERRRLVDGGRLMRACGQWLRLAALVGASPDVLEARARSVAAHPTREAVAAARKLYTSTVDATCRAARRSKDWGTVADLRFRQARAYHRAGGAPIPPEHAVVAIHVEAIDASLRQIAETSRDALLVGGACCEACSSRSGRVTRVSAERKAPTLPHADCPVGLCGCRWKAPARRAADRPAKKRAKASSAAAAKSSTVAG